jgi:hypothetical protein
VTGETCQFNIRNQNSGYFYQKNFYKLAQNDECIVFAMEESFDSEACIFPETAELIADLFGKHNPLHPQGTPIADLNRFVFGSEWRQNGGRDNENRLLILVYRSDFAEEGSYGYFRPVDQLYPAGGYNDYYSNGGEIIYINENALNSIQEIVSTVSHEFQHCIFLNQAYIKDGDFSGSNNASLFFNEGCAMLASDLNYAESPQMTEFAAECLHDSLSSFSFFGLVDFEGYSMDYGRAWLIVKYIYEKSGQSHLQQMIRTTPEFYNAHLSPSKSNEEFLMDWHCALRLSGRTTSDICYKDMDLFKTVTSTEGNEYLLEGSLRILKKPEELSVFPLCAPGVSCNLAIDGNNHCGKVYIDFKKENSGARALLFDTNGQFLNFKQINN